MVQLNILLSPLSRGSTTFLMDRNKLKEQKHKNRKNVFNSFLLERVKPLMTQTEKQRKKNKNIKTKKFFLLLSVKRTRLQQFNARIRPHIRTYARVGKQFFFFGSLVSFFADALFGEWQTYVCKRRLNA